MPENLFDIMARLPMLAEAMRNYKSPEGQDEEALVYVRSKWGNAKEEDIYSSTTDVLRVRRDEETCAGCEGKCKCPLNYRPLFFERGELSRQNNLRCSRWRVRFISGQNLLKRRTV